jgi:hypothetical protein
MIACFDMISPRFTTKQWTRLYEAPYLPHSYISSLSLSLYDEQSTLLVSPYYERSSTVLERMHVRGGLVAHWILNQKAYALLYKAKPLVRVDSGIPSWFSLFDSTHS